MINLKKHFLYIIIPLSLFLIIYGIFVFVSWEVNPKEWHGSVRMIFSVIEIIAIAIGIGGTNEYINKDF